MHIITGICAQFLRIIIIQGSESKQISSCQIESDTLNAQLGQKLSLPCLLYTSDAADEL